MFDDYLSLLFKLSRAIGLVVCFLFHTRSLWSLEAQRRGGLIIFLVSPDLPSQKLWQGREGGNQKSASPCRGR